MSFSRTTQANPRAKSRTRNRYRFETLFRLFGQTALCLSLLVLTVLVFKIFGSGLGAFYRSELLLSVELQLDVLGLAENEPVSPKELARANFSSPLKRALYAELGLESASAGTRRESSKLLSSGAIDALRETVLRQPEKVGQSVRISVPLSSTVDQYLKGQLEISEEASFQSLSSSQREWIRELEARGLLSREFNRDFLFSGDSRSPELAGIGAAVLGSFFALLICFLISFPLGIAAALYLEEFAPKNRFTDMIEININNLAAVPSIIFGLLGLAILLNFFGMPRSTPLVGGSVLALMTLPTIIIACRASLKSVPDSIRHGALAMGASPVQVAFHHVLPLALPGTLTGTIIGLAQALGETAPLLMIGMVAFIADVPHSPMDPSAALPVQIYLWAESAERGFVEKASAAIMVILVFLFLMNALAVFLREKLERRW